MFSSYIDCHEDQLVYLGIPQRKQFCLVRKQYDQRMQKLSKIAVNQKRMIMHYEKKLKRESAADSQSMEAFEMDFEELFNQKMKLVDEQ